MRIEEAQPEDLRKVSLALQEATTDMHPGAVMCGVHVFLYALKCSGLMSERDIYEGLLEMANWFEGENKH